MRPFELVRTGVGVLALAAMLLLASPGVRVVRAAGEESVSSQAGRCGAVPSAEAEVELEAFLATLRREQLARIAARDAGLLMLNGRGYNYGPPPRIRLDLLRAEAARADRR